MELSMELSFGAAEASAILDVPYSRSAATIRWYSLSVKLIFMAFLLLFAVWRPLAGDAPLSFSPVSSPVSSSNCCHAQSKLRGPRAYRGCKRYV
jgi:hypothetical protein